MEERQRRTLKMAEKLVESTMAGRDASHDAAHAFRVRDLALSLAIEEGLESQSLEIWRERWMICAPRRSSCRLEVVMCLAIEGNPSGGVLTVALWSHYRTKHGKVELAALLHDIGDYKYNKNFIEDTLIVESFLEEEGVEESKKMKILEIIKGMGFKNEILKKNCIDSSLEFGLVQDADRLDAIGAIGIARCFTYGGSTNQILHDPEISPRQDLSKEKYMNKTEKQTTINHFHEKLFKLKDIMKTEAGRRRAKKRHKFMKDFIEEFYEEWNGRA